MKIYHSKVEGLDDIRARAIVEEHRAAVESAGGTITSPNAPVQPPAIIVLELPEGVEPSSIIPDLEFVLVEAE